MPNSVRLMFPYPSKDQDPWFPTFEDMVIAIDQFGYANREDRNIVLGGGGDFSWDAGTGTLSWSDTLEFYSTISGFRLDLPAGSIVLQDGESLYVDLVRFPITNGTLTAEKAFTVPNTNDAYVISVRRDAEVFFTTGTKLINGETRDIFSGGGAGADTDTYERMATFGVPLGDSDEEATLGRINFPGSVVGLAIETTEAVTGGSIVVDVKRNGAVLLSGTLDTGTPVSTTLTAASGTYPVSSNDQITVEYTATSYNNASAVPGGLTANVTFSAGISLPAGGIPDASSTVKGITKLSVDPVLANDPIAVGDNDPRLFESRRFIYTIQPTDGADFIVTIPTAMSDSDYVVMHTLATVTTHVTINIPTADRIASQFRVLMSAPLVAGDTIYFNVIEL